MKNLLRAGAVALGLMMSCAALAQSAPEIRAPAGYAPIQAPCVRQADASCKPVDSASALPVAASAPMASAADATTTRTSLAANTNTTICPAVAGTDRVVTEIWVTPSGVGLGLDGQTLTTATVGTATTSPHFATSSGNAYYFMPAGRRNAITAYGAAGMVVCVQTKVQ